jgi:hypothetical protein
VQDLRFFLSDFAPSTFGIPEQAYALALKALDHA